MVVDRTNVFTEPRDVVVSLLKSNVTDPKSALGTRRWYYRLFPDTTSRTFSGYPIIVINPVDISDEALTLNNCTWDNDMLFEIEIYAEFNDEFARTDVIANKIYQALKLEASLDILQTNNMFTPQILSSTPSTTTKDSKLLSVRLMRVTFNNTL